MATPSSSRVTSVTSRGWSSSRGTEFVTRVSAEHAETTLEHIGRAPMFSMDKARTLLGFVPQHSVTDTVIEAIDAWAEAHPT